jgi:histidine triad (HIT) family protein
MSSLFTRMIQGEIPCHVVAENAEFLAFLDVFPRHKGHTLVVPKQEINHVQDMDPEHFARFTAFAHRVGSLLHREIGTSRMGWAIAGFEVPHVHIHLIPADKMDDMNLNRPGERADDEELAQLAARLRAAGVV